MEAILELPAIYHVAAIAVLGGLVIVLAARLRGVSHRARALEHEAQSWREAESVAREEAENRQRHCESLQSANHEMQLELARIEATHGERERAFQLMKEELNDSRERLKADFQNLASQVLQERERHFHSSSQDAMGVLLQPFREQLQAFQQRVNQVHDESLRGNVSLATEVRRLSDVGMQMSREAETLAMALKGDKKLMGNWGEVQLERSLQLAGLERDVHYEAQARFKDLQGDVRLPDFILKLPDGKHVVLDSKVSLVDYDRALSAATDAGRRAALDAHVRAVRNHIDDLARKDYSALPGMGSPGFVLMFMPVEAAYIEALRHDRALFDYGSRQNVILVSHTTLMPVLKTVSNLWMLARSNAQAQVLADRAGELYNQVAMVAERLKKLGDSLDTVSRHYNHTVTAVAGQQGLYGKVGRFREVSLRANRKMPDLQPLAADIDSEKLALITDSVE
ncbi:MAG: DNA recombination protein RmuC [Alcaligenaceae bacterium]|nr:DNA recombination protein RmuC [Alcaligenaceae bacterium]